MQLDLWTPTREWDGEDAFLVGGGPSLAGFDFSLLRPLNVLGCNDAFHLGAGVVDFCVFGDAGWWNRNKWTLEKNFAGRTVTNAPSLIHLKIPNVLRMRRVRDGIHSGDTLGWNYSTGALAINLAISLGARRIFLLGYDLCNRDGASHWHVHGKATQQYAFDRFRRGFDMVKASLPAGVQVFNVTDGGSKLTAFPMFSFEALAGLINPASQASITSDPDDPAGLKPAGSREDRSETKPNESVTTVEASP